MLIRYRGPGSAEPWNLNNLRVGKVSFALADLPPDVEVHNIALRVSSASPLFGSAAPWITNTGETVPDPWLVWPGSYSNGSTARSYFCSATNTTYNWSTATFDPDLEDARLDTWSIGYSDEHFTVGEDDYKVGTSGDAAADLPLSIPDLESAYQNGDGDLIIPLSGWESKLEDGSISLIFSIDDTPVNRAIQRYGYNSFGIVWEDQGLHDAIEECSGTPPFTVQEIDEASGTIGGLSLAGVQLVITHAPYYPDPPYSPEIDERGFVYFEIPQLPADSTITKAELLLWNVMAFSTESAEVYGIRTDPEIEGEPPITVESLHPEGLEDKTARAIWTAQVNDLPPAPPETWPVLTTISVNTTGLRSGRVVGFQFAIAPETNDPFQFSQVQWMLDMVAGGPGSPYHGPRLQLTLLMPTGLDEVPVSVTMLIAPVQVSAAIEVEQTQRILIHKAVQNRATRRSQ